jgi:hypothetical protein
MSSYKHEMELEKDLIILFYFLINYPETRKNKIIKKLKSNEKESKSLLLLEKIMDAFSMVDLVTLHVTNEEANNEVERLIKKMADKKISQVENKSFKETFLIKDKKKIINDLNKQIDKKIKKLELLSDGIDGILQISRDVQKEFNKKVH